MVKLAHDACRVCNGVHPHSGDKRFSAYQFDQSRYFDWAKGVRATDENHRVAQETYLEIMKSKKEGRPGVERRSDFLHAQMAIEELFLGSGDGQNVIFGNSSTLVALTIIAAMIDNSKKQPKGSHVKKGLVPRIVPLTMAEKISPYGFWDHGNSRGSYPTILNSTTAELEELLQSITQQNYGIECLDNAKLLQELRRLTGQIKQIKLHGYEELKELAEKYAWMNPDRINYWSESETREQLDEEAWAATSTAFGIMPIDQIERLNGAIVPLDEIRKINLGRIASLPVVDVSHSFGILDMHHVHGGVLLAGSSKGLAAEPTIGIACMDDTVRIEVEAFLANNPQVAQKFQLFSRKIGDKWEDVQGTLSLPEIRSLAHAAQQTMKYGLERIRKDLEGLNKRLKDGLKRCDVRFGVANLSDYQAPLQVAIKRTQKAAEKLPNYLVIKTKKPANEVATELLKEGYAVSVIDDLPWNYKRPDKPTNTCLRISLRHDVDQDIEGFVKALKNILATP